MLWKDSDKGLSIMSGISKCSIFVSGLLFMSSRQRPQIWGTFQVGWSLTTETRRISVPLDELKGEMTRPKPFLIQASFHSTMNLTVSGCHANGSWHLSHKRVEGKQPCEHQARPCLCWEGNAGWLTLAQGHKRHLWIIQATVYFSCSWHRGHSASFRWWTGTW